MGQKLVDIGNTISTIGLTGFLVCASTFFAGAFLWAVGKCILKGYF